MDGHPNKTKLINTGLWILGVVLVAIITVAAYYKFEVLDPTRLGADAELIQSGKALYKKNGCFICHGADGKHPTAVLYPKIHDQRREYLKQQILDIRDGRRVNGLTAMMRSLVTNLTDEEVDKISIYLESIK